MRNEAKFLVGLAVSMGVFLGSGRAEACSSSQTEVYKSAKTVWCVENSLIAKNGTFPKEFYSYGDSVVDELAFLFAVPPEGVYTFEASVPTGGAHTGSECCGLGVTVTGDAFYGDGYGVKGFWGYLLSLHEMINDWTGQVTSGWPTDFWADHISAFPNSMDWHIMSALGAKLSDANLTAASAAQKKRFYPGGDSADPRVVAFDKIFAMPDYDFAGLNRVFGYIKKDKLNWDGLGVPNPDPKRTEYVIAYLSLGAHALVTKTLQAANVGNGMPDGAGDKGYTVNDGNIDAIATAHCAIISAAAQGGSVGADQTAFRAGNFAAVKAAGKCGAGCPSECGCKSSTDRCVAPWLADAPPADAGVMTDAATTDTGSAEDTGTPSTDDAAVPTDDASITDDGGSHGADVGTNDDTGSEKADSSGCSCRVPSSGAPKSTPWLAVSALAVVAMVRARRRR